MNTLANQIADTMKQKVVDLGLSLLENYPNDLLVDRNILAFAAVPGASIAWMCGNLHTHLVSLGINTSENEKVGYLTNLSNSDHFFLVNIDNSGSYTMKEISRKEFSDLSNSKIRYTQKGIQSDFSLYRDDRKVGHIQIEPEGSFEDRVWNCFITPCGSTQLDCVALHYWANDAANKLAHSLFAKRNIVWHKQLAI